MSGCFKMLLKKNLRNVNFRIISSQMLLIQLQRVHTVLFYLAVSVVQFHVCWFTHTKQCPIHGSEGQLDPKQNTLYIVTKVNYVCRVW